MSMLILNLILMDGNRNRTILAMNGEVVVRWSGNRPCASMSCSFSVTKSASSSVIAMSP